MDLEGVVAGLDHVHWTDLEHAYGEAEDLPETLRALLGTEEESREALDELWGSILHQGTVYTATEAAVPFLARAAVAGVRPAELLALLGGIAESQDPFDVAPDACRAAVVAQLPLLVPLLDSPDERVRRTVAWTAGVSGSDRVLPALRERWRREGEPGVRAELLAALARLDPRGSAPALAAALTSGSPAELRIVAVLAALDSGRAWTPRHRDALLELLPAGPRVAGRLDDERAEPLRYVTETLLLRDTDENRAAAFGLVESALALPDPEARKEALWAAEHACMLSRAAPARLAPAVVALLGDPCAPEAAFLLPVLDRLGRHAAPAAPALAALAAEGGELADRALALLVELAPDRAAPLLARDLGARTRALTAASGGHRRAAVIPYAPELLNAVRIRLTAPGAEELTSAEADRLLTLVIRWGGVAEAALPELTAVLERFPARVPEALVAVCPAGHRDAVAARLRRAAGAGEHRRAAAEALSRLTGETGPLLDALAEALAEGASPDTARAAGGLGAAGAPLVPCLRLALTPPGRGRVVLAMETDIELALALWRLTGESAEAVKTVGGVLAEAGEGGAVEWYRGPRIRAARAAGLLGAEAAALAPALRAMLADPREVPAAVRALRAIPGELPGALSTAAAADLLLGAVERHAAPEEALETLAALGQEALTAEVRERLGALAERDRRVVYGKVAEDERVVDLARTLLAG
ncbi:HEAT repeat domain-containing protein [Streptomyces sp. NPDC057638]|uniref:HEAT repeat domain-containing protein n=1 Tax=Streptomyces sp. NPDC057638 TaxID=3346190 RepID=UPI0036CA3CB4